MGGFQSQDVDLGVEFIQGFITYGKNILQGCPGTAGSIMNHGQGSTDHTPFCPLHVTTLYQVYSMNISEVVCLA
jgi:hypothetical protein